MIRLIFRFKASARIACVSSLERVVVVLLLLLLVVAGSLPRTARSPRGSFSFPLSLFKSFLLLSTIPHIYTFKSILKRSRRPTKRRKHAERRLLLHHPLSSFATPLSLSLSLSLIVFRFHRPLFPLVLFFECDAYYLFFFVLK